MINTTVLKHIRVRECWNQKEGEVVKNMGFPKEEKSKRVLRGVKIVFFLITMVFSLLIFSAPVLLVIADALVPSALLSAFSPSSSLFSHFQNYHFGYSLIDIPILSIARSLIILCVYSFCDGPRLSRGPYLGVTMLCSVMSLIFVCSKVIYVFSYDRSVGERGLGYDRGSQISLFVWSCSLAVGHVVVAYRTSCRERRKLLVYKIDIEAVRACSSYFISLHDKTQKEENDISLFSCK